MNSISKLTLLVFSAVILLALPQDTFAQVSKTVDGFRVKTRDGDYHLEKNVPFQKNPEIRGDGLPTKMFVVQLARFEDLAHLPSSFPKGTFLYVNPDHPQEKFLLTGFYGSIEDAKAGALEWRRRPEFKGAFARATPFIVKYD